jgi:hydroxyacylglutathione hydrolase
MAFSYFGIYIAIYAYRKMPFCLEKHENNLKQRENVMGKKLFKLWITLMVGCLFISVSATGVLAADAKKGAAAGPTLQEKAKAAGFEVVDYDYVKKAVGSGVGDFQKTVIVDARPARMYVKGHIPTAVNLEQMKFKKSYPKFEALNIAKDTELIFGIGKNCPLSYKDAMELKKVGYTNLKLYIKPAIWIASDYMEVGTKGAQKLFTKKAAFVDVRPAGDFGKGSIPGAVNISANTLAKAGATLPGDKAQTIVTFGNGANDTAPHMAANQLKKMGYKKVFAYVPGYSAWKTPAAK